MVVLIAMLCGVLELTALIALFGVNTGMILLGLDMERTQSPGRDADWRPFWFGSGLGAVPWVVIYYESICADQQADVPDFVFGIFFSLLVLFVLFPLNMALQYRRVGAWRDAHVRREGLHCAQPDREVGARLAGLRRGSGGLDDKAGFEPATLRLVRAGHVLGVRHGGSAPR